MAPVYDTSTDRRSSDPTWLSPVPALQKAVPAHATGDWLGWADIPVVRWSKGTFGAFDPLTKGVTFVR